MRARVLFQDSRLSLTRFDHAPGVPHRDPDREESSSYAVSFVERGAFDLLTGGSRWRLSSRVVLVTWPGMSYRCAHASETPDDVCLSLHCPADLIEEASSATGRNWSGVTPVAPLTNRLAYLASSLAGAASGKTGPDTVPSLASEVLAALLEPGPVRALHRPGQLSWYARRVDAARELMHLRFAEPLTIDALSREVAISPFHFSRVFRELTGMPPHRYLVKVRLAAAARALRGGASVTRAAQDAGFGNLSQFIRQFRRAHGVSPGRYRHASNQQESARSRRPAEVTSGSIPLRRRSGSCSTT